MRQPARSEIPFIAAARKNGHATGSLESFALALCHICSGYHNNNHNYIEKIGEQNHLRYFT